MSDKNCTKCLWATTVTDNGRRHWHCTPNDMDVNERMICEEWRGSASRKDAPVFSMSVSSLSPKVNLMRSRQNVKLD